MMQLLQTMMADREAERAERQANLAALQQIAQNNQGHGNHDHPGSKLKNFQNTNPPMFSKTEEPLDADDWLQTIENNLEVAGVEAAEKVLFATNYLSGPARAWWTSARAMNAGQMMTWEDFKLKFSKYHPPAQTYRPNYSNNNGGPPKPGGNNNNNRNPNSHNNNGNNTNTNTGPRTGSNAIPVAPKDKSTPASRRNLAGTRRHSSSSPSTIHATPSSATVPGSYSPSPTTPRPPPSTAGDLLRSPTPYLAGAARPSPPSTTTTLDRPIFV
ncbi:hypothetical protein QYE76_071867 [Lolium multiflorum]|uniref:Retrotransposon gag domain-containing protein n=1 Tax=Lolium multiflorum TaxID=4521 RepID=A0AAD8WH79_LOLMU|nr:hypothetical protein QYE76_071867 [Lolium multiflorum]